MNPSAYSGPTTRSMYRKKSFIENPKTFCKSTEKSTNKRVYTKDHLRSESYKVKPKFRLSRSPRGAKDQTKGSTSSRITKEVKGTKNKVNKQKLIDAKVIVKASRNSERKQKGNVLDVRQSIPHQQKCENAHKQRHFPVDLFANSEYSGYFQVEKINSFQGKGKNPNAICPVSDSMAWIAFSFMDTIYLYNFIGEIQKFLKMPGLVDDIAVKRDGSLLVTNHGGNKIWVVNSTYTTIRELEGLEIKPPSTCRGICLDNQYMYLCLTDSFSMIATDNCKAFCLKINDKGKIMEKFEKSDKGKIFFHPYRIAVNTNGDVLVVDIVRSRMIILDPNGKEKSSYGETRTRTGSNINGVCCNADGFIFVTNCNKGCVDVLYPDGSFCQTVGGDLGDINNIKMDKCGHLWVGALKKPCINTFKVFR